MLRVTEVVDRRQALYETIRCRRSIGRVRPEVPPRETIERVIEAATWAPNHHKIEPWYFHVLTGDARAALGHAVAESIQSRAADPEDPIIAAKIVKARKAPLRAPYVIAVSAQDDPDPMKHRENYAAAAAAIQNLLLATEVEGLGAIWRTGSMVDDPAAKRFLTIPEQREIVGFVYVGYPDLEPPPATRLPVMERITWLG